VQSFTAHVRDVIDLTHDVRQIALALREPSTMEFAPGQFVSFEIPKPGLPFPVTRPYSIASPPTHRDTIDLLLNLVPGGPGSEFLFSLKSGDAVTFSGPAGTFVLREYPDRRLLFVATGTGIAPIRSMIHARLPSPTLVTLIWGLRNERDLYYQDELAELAKEFPEFSYTVTLSQPSPGWRGHSGRVQAAVEAVTSRVDDLAVYLCGGREMIKSVTALIRSRGVCPIHWEQYY